MVTIFKRGALIGDYRYDKNAVAVVSCDDRYTSAFLNNMTKEKLLSIEKQSKRWKYLVDIEWL